MKSSKHQTPERVWRLQLEVSLELGAWDLELSSRLPSEGEFNIIPAFTNGSSMNQFKFSCPQCQQHLQCDEQFSGREIQCPGCNHLIRIPPVPGKTAAYQPESGKTWATFVPPGNAAKPGNLSMPPKKNNPEPPAK